MLSPVIKLICALQGTAADSVLHTAAFENHSPEFGVQRHLSDAGANITFNCYALANAMPAQARATIQSVFDVEVRIA